MSVQIILDKYKNISPEIVDLVTESILNEFKEKYPDIDWSLEENIDFIVRPLVAVSLVSEIEKETILSLSTIDSIVNNSLLDDKQKLIALKKYATILGIKTSSEDWQTLLSEIKFFIKNRWYNIRYSVYDFLISKFEIRKVYIADSNSKEMVRNRIPIVPIPTNFIPYYNREQSVVNTLSIAFDRNEIEQYKNAINNSIELPNFLDVYLFKDIKKETITIEKVNSLYSFPKKYWISINHPTKQVVLKTTEKDTLNGLTSMEVKAFVVDGEEKETFEVMYYDLPNENDIKLDGILDNANILLKGYFPLFLDFIILSEDPEININEIDKIIDEYLETINFDYRYFNLTQLNNLIREKYNALISTNISGKLYLAPNLYIDQTINFPIAPNDIKIEIPYPSRQVSENTIIIQKSSIKISNEL